MGGNMSKLYIVGIGPGSKEYLTKIAIKTVKKADFVIGSKRALDLFEEYNEKIELNVKDLQEKLELGVDLSINNKSVCMLSTGDPGFSGILKPVLKIAKEKGVDEDKIEVIPGISSLQLSAAKTKIPWDDANIITLHGRENQEDILKILDNGKTTIVLPSKSVKDMAEFLIKSGIDKEREVVICEKLSYNDEKIVRTTLKDVSKSDFTYLCVMTIF
jgi:cobalt-precorrin-7 (C5)-methyltransferase